MRYARSASAPAPVPGAYVGATDAGPSRNCLRLWPGPYPSPPAPAPAACLRLARARTLRP